MGGIAFDGVALRGEIGSKARHKNLKQMHKDEKEFNDKQELKKKINQLVVKEVKKYTKKEKPMFGKEYFRIETEDDKAFVEDLVNLVLEQMQNNINIVTDSELKQTVEELTNQLLNKGEVIAKNNQLEQSNEELIQENEKLKEANANLNNQDNIIKDRNLQISDLSAELIQKEDENNKLKSRLENIKVDIAQIDELKQKADQSDALQIKLKKANADLESKEKTNQSLKQINGYLEASKTKEETLKKDNDNKQLLFRLVTVNVVKKIQHWSRLL